MIDALAADAARPRRRPSRSCASSRWRKRLGQRARDPVGAGQHQDARGVLVQPVHQLGLAPCSRTSAPRSAPSTWRSPCPLPPWLGRPGGLFRTMMCSSFHRTAAWIILASAAETPPRRGPRRRGASVGQRRHADRLPGATRSRRLDPATVDPDLPCAAHLFDRALGQLRKAARNQRSRRCSPSSSVTVRSLHARSCKAPPGQGHARRRRRARERPTSPAT